MCTFGTRALSEGPCGELDASRRGLCGITWASPCADCIGYPGLQRTALRKRR